MARLIAESTVQRKTLDEVMTMLTGKAAIQHGQVPGNGQS